MLNKFSKIFMAIAACIFISNEADGQDAAFSQFYANPLYLNPAFAGATPKGCPRASLNWRDQWPGIGSSYITTSASWDKHINAIGGGLGIIVVNDRSGNGGLQLNSALYFITFFN